MPDMNTSEWEDVTADYAGSEWEDVTPGTTVDESAIPPQSLSQGTNPSFTDKVSSLPQGITDFGAAAAANLPFGASEALAGVLAPEGVSGAQALEALRSTREDIGKDSPVANVLGQTAGQYAPYAFVGPGGLATKALVAGTMGGASSIARQGVEDIMDPEQARQKSMLDRNVQTAKEAAIGAGGELLPAPVKWAGNKTLDAVLSTAGIPRHIFDAYVSNPSKYTQELPENLVRMIRAILEGKKVDPEVPVESLAKVNSLADEYAALQGKKQVAKDVLRNQTQALDNLKVRDQALEARVREGEASGKENILLQREAELVKHDAAVADLQRQYDLERQAAEYRAADAVSQERFAKEAELDLAAEKVPNPNVLTDEYVKGTSGKLRGTFDNIKSDISSLAATRAKQLAQGEVPGEIVSANSRRVGEALRSNFPDLITNEDKALLDGVQTYDQFSKAFDTITERLQNRGIPLSSTSGATPLERQGPAIYSLLSKAESEMLRSHPNAEMVAASTKNMRDLYQARDMLQRRLGLPETVNNNAEQELARIETKLRSKGVSELTPTEREWYSKFGPTQDVPKILEDYTKLRDAPAELPKYTPEELVSAQLPYQNAVTSSQSMADIASSRTEDLLNKVNELKASRPVYSPVTKADVQTTPQYQAALREKELFQPVLEKAYDINARLKDAAYDIDSQARRSYLALQDLKRGLGSTNETTAMSVPQIASQVRRTLVPGSKTGDLATAEAGEKSIRGVLEAGGLEPSQIDEILQDAQVAEYMKGRLKNLGPGSTEATLFQEIGKAITRSAEKGGLTASTLIAAKNFFNKGQLAWLLNKTRSVTSKTTDTTNRVLQGRALDWATDKDDPLTPKEEKAQREAQWKTYLRQKYPDKFRDGSSENEQIKAEVETAFLEQDAGNLPRNPEV
jgi:hypothetical protein